MRQGVQILSLGVCLSACGGSGSPGVVSAPMVLDTTRPLNSAQKDVVRRLLSSMADNDRIMTEYFSFRDGETETHGLKLRKKLAEAHCSSGKDAKGDLEEEHPADKKGHIESIIKGDGCPMTYSLVQDEKAMSATELTVQGKRDYVLSDPSVRPDADILEEHLHYKTEINEVNGSQSLSTDLAGHLLSKIHGTIKLRELAVIKTGSWSESITLTLPDFAADIEFSLNSGKQAPKLTINGEPQSDEMAIAWAKAGLVPQ